MRRRNPKILMSSAPSSLAPRSRAGDPSVFQDELIVTGSLAGDYALLRCDGAAIANSITAESEALLMQGVAGAVSITIPLIVLVLIFQKQIVGGLTQGAVKG